MAASQEQVELLVSADTCDHANSTTLSHASLHRGQNLIDFDVKYGRKLDADVTSCCDSVLSRIRGMSCKCEHVWNFIERHVPVINLIRTYKFRQDVLGDVVAGLSVGVMTVPQSMGYSLLASMPPKYGLYTSLFPVLVYFIFGTSRHVSLGTMALSSLLIHSAIDRDAPQASDLNITGNGTSMAESLDATESRKVMIAMSVSMTAGLIMFVMSLFQLGFIVTYMSDSFISGYIAAANILVLTHQAKIILGVKTVSRGSMLEIVFLMYDICRNILDTNLMQVLIAVLSISALVLVKQCINERFKSRLKVPIPIDLIVVIIATVVSYFGNFRQTFDVKVVNEIPYGIPAPVIPSPKLMYSYWFEGFMVAIISYFLVAMMAVLFAQRHNYSVDNNQELAANGLSCIVGALFNGLASSTSPPRCFLMESTGGRTQVAYVVSAMLVLVTIYFIAPLFEALPLCVLASIIVVACIPLFVHYTMWRTYWRTDRYDFAIWVVSFCGTFVAGVDYGMIVGVAFSVIVVHFRMQHSKSSSLALNVEDFLFLDSGRYNNASCLTGTAVFSFHSSLYFATLAVFKQQLFASSISLSELRARQKLANKQKKNVIVSAEKSDGIAAKETDCDGNGQVIDVGNAKESMSSKDQSEGLPVGENAESALVEELVDGKDGHNIKQEKTHNVQNIIVECSAISFVDTAGCMLLGHLHAEYGKHGIRFVLAGCGDDVVSSLKRADQCQKLCKDDLYPSVQSAVLCLHCDLF